MGWPVFAAEVSKLQYSDNVSGGAQEIEFLHYSLYSEVRLIVILRRENPDMKYGNNAYNLSNQLIYRVRKRLYPFFIFYFFLGAQCVESGVSCTDSY
jgi:hypothetical protein